MNKNILVVLLIVSLFFTSCNIFRTKHITVKNDTVNVLKIKLPSKSGICFDSIENHYFRYQTLLGKFDMSFAGNDNQGDLNGTIKIVKDSVILITLSPGLGIEAARILFSPDSIKFINRISGTYFLGDYNYISKTYGIVMDFKTIQEIFTNQLFIYPVASIKRNTVSDYLYFSDSSSVYLQNVSDSLFAIYKADSVKYKNGKLLNKITIGKNDYRVKSAIINDLDNKRFMVLNYNKFQVEEKQIIPMEMVAKLSTVKQNLSVEIRYKKFNLNKNEKVKFDIPSNYKRIN